MALRQASVAPATKNTVPACVCLQIGGQGSPERVVSPRFNQPPCGPIFVEPERCTEPCHTAFMCICAV